MYKFIAVIALLITAANTYAQTIPAPNARFSNNGRFKISITSSDTIYTVVHSKKAGVDTIPDGSWTNVTNTYNGGVVTQVAKNVSTDKSKDPKAVTIICLYNNLCPITEDTSVTVVYSTKIFFWANKQKEHPAIVIPTRLAESLSKKGLEDLLIQQFLLSIVKPKQVGF